eukprot:362899-Chlamydomonas_euryale.AAC.4
MSAVACAWPHLLASAHVSTFVWTGGCTEGAAPVPWRRDTPHHVIPRRFDCPAGLGHLRGVARGARSAL